jgi:hypothetical protein
VLAEEQAKGSPERGRSALRSGALTGLSYVALSLAAALAGAFLAHKFGRNLRTDGFMAAYGVYLVLVLGAQAFRMVVVPDLTRAEEEGRLGAEFRAYCLAFLVVAIPALFIYSYLNGRIKDLLAGMQVFIDEFIAKMAEFYPTPSDLVRASVPRDGARDSLGFEPQAGGNSHAS